MSSKTMVHSHTRNEEGRYLGREAASHARQSLHPREETSRCELRSECVLSGVGRQSPVLRPPVYKHTSCCTSALVGLSLFEL